MNGKIDWRSVFTLAESPLEIVVRGSLMYLALFFLLRLVLKRQTGTYSTADLLLVVLIADASQNGMAGSYQSVPGGLILVATLIFWNFALDWLGYKVPWFERLLYPAPLQLVREGRMLRRNMRRELITVSELMAHLRENGIESLEAVAEAYMEGDGEISVIRRGAADVARRKKRKT